jgi:hypothetical protein
MPRAVEPSDFFAGLVLLKKAYEMDNNYNNSYHISKKIYLAWRWRQAAQ